MATLLFSSSPVPPAISAAASSRLLLDKKAGRVIAGTRDPDKIADLAAKGAEVRTLDFDRPETLAEGLDGVDRLLLISTDVARHRGPRSSGGWSRRRPRPA